MKGWYGDKNRHKIASYGANVRNRVIPSMKQTFAACSTRARNPYPQDVRDEFKAVYGKEPINITSKSVKQKIFKKLQKDPRFRRVHFKYNTVIFNFKVKDGKNEYWKGGSYTITKDGRVSYGVYVSPKKGKGRYSLREKPILKIMFKDEDDFIDGLYTTMTRLYKDAKRKGYHLDGDVNV